MHTHTSEYYLNTAQGQEADTILRSCVHCGFCLATCPTYQLLGDELDSPRGRIYLIKQLLEEKPVTSKTQTHLDRCLSCHACETTCPSGVQYGRLVDIGREFVDKQVVRSSLSRLKRFALNKLLPYPGRFSFFLKTAQCLKPFLPVSLKQQIPDKQNAKTWPIIKLDKQFQIRKMLVLQGCVQSVSTPNTNYAAANILKKQGVELIVANEAGCCGAVSHHLSVKQDAIKFMQRNIDAWWPHIEQNVEAIVITASGCGAVIKEYGHLLKDDKKYSAKAKKISELAKDISEILSEQNLPIERIQASCKNIAFHSPCTLQHSQKLNGVVESILNRCGFKLTHVEDAHLCCGSAGTYSILQTDLSQQLLQNKLTSLQKYKPELIVTANIGCQLHLQTKTNIPVKHWLELLDESYV